MMTTSIARYRREQGLLLKQVSVDARELEDTFNEWEKKKDNMVQKLIARGK